MQYIRMSYKDFTFSVNPKTLKLTHSKNVATKSIPFGTSKAREISTTTAKISGEGVFVGETARNSIHSLTRIFNDKGAGYLFLPDSTPIKAIFTKLEIHYSADDDKLHYSFEFIEEECKKMSIKDFGYTLARKNENLYDIANRTGTAVEDLFSLNQYADLFSVNEGDKIWLR